MHTTNQPSNVKILLIFQMILQLVALVNVGREEHVHQCQLVYRLSRNGLKLGRMDQHDLGNNKIGLLRKKFVLCHVLGMVDGKRLGFRAFLDMYGWIDRPYDQGTG